MIANQEKEKEKDVVIQKNITANNNQEIGKFNHYYYSGIDLNENNDQDSEKENESLTLKEYKEIVNQLENQVDQKQLFRDAIVFLARFIISFIQFLLSIFVVVLMLVIELVDDLRTMNFSSLNVYLWVMMSISTIIYALVNYFLLGIANLNVSRLYLDGIFFFLSTFLVFSYIKSFQEITYIQNIMECMYNLIYLKLNKPWHKQDFLFFGNVDIYQSRKNRKLEAKQFSLSVLHPKKMREDIILNGLVNFDVDANFSSANFTVLVTIISLKLSGVFYFIYVHSGQLTFVDILDMTLIILVYTYSSFNLLRTFGCYDLKRKKSQMLYFKFIIDFQNDPDLKNNHQKMIDITDPESLEVFDDGRKFLLNLQKDYLDKLDYAYVGLIFYYLFVIIICASYYFDLDWLIHKGSPLLEPMWVIMSTGNFFFLSAFLVFRFKEGTDYNNSFNELEITIDHLLDLVDDLQTMYNTYFIQLDKGGKKIKVEEENKKNELSSPYGLIVKKIKKMSNHFVLNKIAYSGRYYQEHEKTKLRQKILSNMKQALEKVKKSIQTDYKEHKYLFMGFVEVDVNSFLFTLLLGIVTSLPSIIPKFISFYHQS